MRLTVYCLPLLLSLAATSALFGVLESTLNMIGGLHLLFAPGATTVLFTPFLVLFILLGLAVFVATPLFAAATGATLGGFLLRWRGVAAQPAALRLIVPTAVVLHVAFVLLATHYDAGFLLSRPTQRPQVPAYVLACIAGGNGAFASFVAAWILRRLTLGRTPPPIHADQQLVK